MDERRITLLCQRGVEGLVGHPAWCHGGQRGARVRVGPTAEGHGLLASEEMAARIGVGSGEMVRLEKHP